MSEPADIFDVIEQVRALRAGSTVGDTYAIRQRVLDVLVIATRQGHDMSLSELAEVFMEMKEPILRTTITRSLRELQDFGHVIYVGKEPRSGIARTQRVPVYRVTDVN